MTLIPFNSTSGQAGIAPPTLDGNTGQAITPSTGATPSAPDTLTATYNPLNPEPYKVPEVPDLPPVTAPPQTNWGSVSQDGRSLAFGGGAKGVIGSVATIGDSILRGYMQGKQAAETKKIYQAAKITRGLQFAYQTASQKYLEMVKQGADPNSTEMQEAKSNRDATWATLMQFYGNHILGTGGKKPSKGKTTRDETENPMALIGSKDPTDVSKGWYLMMQRTGPPDEYQAASIRAQQQQYQQSPQGQIATLTHQYEQLASVPGSQQTPEQKAQIQNVLGRIQQLKEIEAPYSKTVSSGGNTDFSRALSTYAAEHNTTVDRLTYDDVLKVKKELGEASRVAPKPRTAWTRDTQGRIFSAELDAQNRIVPGTENYNLIPPSYMISHVHKGEFTFTDDQGNTYRVPTVSTTSPMFPGASATTAARPVESAHQFKAPEPSATATTTPSSAASPAASALAAPEGGHYIGKVTSKEDLGIQRSLLSSSEKFRSMAAMLKTNEEYMKSVQDGKAKPTPRQDLALIVAAVRAMNPNTVRLPQQELSLEIKAGSYTDRMRRAYDNAVKGTLPADQRNDLFNIVRNETTQYGKNIAKDWGAYFKNKPLPAHLRPFTPETQFNWGAYPEVKQ